MASSSNARLRLGLTEAGKVILQGIGFVALAALVFPAFGILSALVWVAFVAFLAGFVLRPKVRLSGNLPDRVMAGQTVRVTYIVENIGRFPAYNLWLKSAGPEAIEHVEDGQMISRLRPGETVEVSLAIRPRRRGHYRIEQPVCLSSFPFNLFSFGLSAQEKENLIVLPAFSRFRIPTRGPIRQVHAGSTRLAGRMGSSPEYAGNRPFVPGDSLRRIDARAWARLSVPATKEYHDDFDSYAAIVLDTGVPEALLRSKPKEIKELEAAVSLCASLAFSISNDSLIDMLVAGPDLHPLADRPRKVRLEKIHEILAGVEPSPGRSLEPIEQILENRFSEISDVFFIVLGCKSAWGGPAPKAYGTLLDSAARAGCRCTVLSVSGSGEIAPEQNLASRASYVRVLSPEEILTGQMRFV
ncbi:MAG: DUF58 domain-containing protein [Phycisphaerales bacterium]|nr:MAG: DUF58 domain-containing protein [Phycisphaerales bacterium]